MKKEVNLYQVNVSTRGPWNIQRTKTGRGCWIVAETSPQKAEETVRAYLKERNLFGNIYPAWKIASETPFGRGTVLRKEDYLAFECFGSEKSNRSIVFTEGKMIEGTWWRDGSNSAPAKYLDFFPVPKSVLRHFSLFSAQKHP